MLLIPEVVELDAASVQRLVARSKDLEQLGLVLEDFGGDAVVVREIHPFWRYQYSVRDLADDLVDMGDVTSQNVSRMCVERWPVMAVCELDVF